MTNSCARVIPAHLAEESSHSTLDRNELVSRGNYVAAARTLAEQLESGGGLQAAGQRHVRLHATRCASGPGFGLIELADEVAVEA